VQTIMMLQADTGHTDRWDARGVCGVGKTLAPPPGGCGSGERGQRYEDQELLGSGGMGDVHACADKRIGRTVAKKCLRARRGEVGATQRFIDEARLQGRLEHPAIVPVYDLGTDEHGTPYFTMKRVRGQTLAAVLAERRKGEDGAWSTRRLLSALSTVALAVDYAHRREVVHGDLKPQNVMLGRFGEVHVLDWGCASQARRQDDGVERGSGVLDIAALASLCHGDSEEGSIVGTPGYLAPEQARGVRGDPQSDVYALGAMLFEIVTLEPLHVGSTPLALLVSVLTGVQSRPSTRAPGVQIPRALDDLIVAAVDDDPTLRPSVRELASAIESILDAEASELGARRSAQRYLEEARDQARGALETGDENARARALRDAGRALALDPENADATELLARLLVQPPQKLPSEARAEIAASQHQLARGVIAGMGTRTLVWLLVVPFALALGVRSPIAAGATIATMLACTAVFFRARKYGELSPLARIGLLGLALLTVACFGGLFGPFALVPLFATTTTTLLTVGLEPRHRNLGVLLGLAAIFAPLALELAQVLPPSFTFTDDAIVLHPRLVAFPPAATLLLLVIGHAVALPMCVVVTGRLWDGMDRARRRLTLRTWQLERALPRRIEASTLH